MRFAGLETFVEIRKGEIVNFTQWDEGEPNNRNWNENCIEIDNGEWNDLNCFAIINGICVKYINQLVFTNGVLI
ncbi:hypothetical protein B4U80_14017 [Leptotrombidium deliense]|uniref:C-type lectin domain-containing protein n=1 Tax=Leptotrombidium deliense TaxID=299467 RepID=A0A443S4Z9_9ACAR|nr:hypothetical protein B4U80_14017 [Leptotrombidium deliense]